MKPAVGNATPRRPNQPTQLPKTEIPLSSIFGFSVSDNQFQLLQDSQPAVSTSPSQIQDRLIDPRKTRLEKQQVARRADEQGTFRNVSNEGILNTIPLVQDVQGTSTSGRNDQPVAFGIQHKFFPDSLFVSPSDVLDSQSGGNVQNSLQTGAVSDDALYYNDVNEVACTLEPCNKRISQAGQEWSVGRPGNRPIGARDAARNTKMCLGTYATREIVQPHTGHNTRSSKEASLGLPRQEDQHTNQPTASASRRSPVAEDRASPATVALHPQRPPCFCGGVDEDVHVWTSIVNRWLDTV